MSQLEAQGFVFGGQNKNRLNKMYWVGLIVLVSAECRKDCPLQFMRGPLKLKSNITPSSFQMLFLLQNRQKSLAPNLVKVRMLISASMKEFSQV